MKKILLKTCLLFALFTGKTFAQYPGMGAVYSRMNQNFIRQQMNMTMNMRMSMMSGVGNSSPKYDFSVVMKDSTLKEVSSKILYDTTKHKSYLEYINKDLPKADPKRKQKIYVDQTIQIKRIDENGTAVTGIARDTCWLFKVVPGPIAAFSYMAESHIYFEPMNIIAIQNETGPTESFRPENLKKMISSDPEAMKLFDKKKYYKALNTYNKNVIKSNK